MFYGRYGYIINFCIESLLSENGKAFFTIEKIIAHESCIHVPKDEKNDTGLFTIFSSYLQTR